MHNPQAGVGRNNIHVVWEDELIVDDLTDRQLGGARQNLRQRTLMSRVEVRDENHSHVGVRRQMGEQLGKRLQASRGRADAGNRK